MPHRLITERGTKFKSKKLQTLSKICGIKLQHKTEYHPACKGKVEGLTSQNIKNSIKSSHNLSWADTLLTVLFGLRTAVQEDNNHSIARIVHGESLRFSGELFRESSIQTASERFANILRKQIETVVPRTTLKTSSQKTYISA
ncbi:hypothetical protein AVEN_173121-1 [Araneus ventricosus]|uniref:Integrase catalytic domain-containing protein n=1 Tax=Araneus ventricosus TaxID=182803 RepID=A0A4Y2FMJ3_ARAVE|nr:hypothetical protein AVEN_173121-1 [Araneus ventricosus]